MYFISCLMINTNKEKVRIIVSQLQEDEQYLSTLRLSSYKSQKTSTRIDNKSSSSCRSSKYVFLIIIVFMIGIGLLNSVFNCAQLQLLSKQAQQKLLSKQIEWQKLSQKNKLTGQKINQLQQQNKRLNEKVGELDKNTPAQTKRMNDQNSKYKNIFNIEYDSSNYQPLPINPLRAVDDKTIAHYLYKDEAKIKSRDKFIQQRISFINSRPSVPQLYLAKYNFIKNQEMLKEATTQNQKNWQRIQRTFKISSVTQELQFCIIVPSYNNNANFRIEGNLNSIFTQNYTKYKVAIINDASTDKSGDIYKEYFKFYKIDKSKYVYVQNPARVTALKNIYETSIYWCNIDSIAMILDGDDEFIGRNVLSTFNWAFQSKKAGVIYSNFLWYQQRVNVRYGFTQSYTQDEKKNNRYRNVPMKFSQLRAYRAQLMQQITAKDLQDQKGVYYTIAYDMALFLPLFELACGRVEKIQGEFHYLYNYGTGLNDDFLNRGKQLEVDRRVRGQKKYDCYKPFEQRMKK